MKAEEITDSLLDEIVESIFDSKTGFARIFPIVKTDDIAEVLWKKYRIHIWKDVEIVREKIRSWWKNKEQYYDPHPHKWIGKYAVFTGAPMRRHYAMLERKPTPGFSDKALIIAYTGETLKSIIKQKKLG